MIIKALGRQFWPQSFATVLLLSGIYIVFAYLNSPQKRRSHQIFKGTHKSHKREYRKNSYLITYWREGALKGSELQQGQITTLVT